VSARSRDKLEAWSLEKVYSIFPILKERAKLQGNLLSGGEQQMLAIGRALMPNPDMPLMDEPSEGLAPIIVRDITGIIRQLKESGLSILLVEQNLPMALSVADYLYIVSKGMIVYNSTPEELKTNNSDVKAKFFGISG